MLGPSERRADAAAHPPACRAPSVSEPAQRFLKGTSPSVEVNTVQWRWETKAPVKPRPPGRGYPTVRSSSYWCGSTPDAEATERLDAPPLRSLCAPDSAPVSRRRVHASEGAIKTGHTEDVRSSSRSARGWRSTGSHSRRTVRRRGKPTGQLRFDSDQTIAVYAPA